MKISPGPLKKAGSHWGLFLVTISFLITGCRETGLDLKDVPGLLSQKQEILSRMRIDLLKSVEAEKSAVMADTDEASQSFARETQKATALVEQGRQEIGKLMERDHTGGELKLLQEFDLTWGEFLKTDKVILDYAVQNTNLKAARLSFASGEAAMNRLEKALSRLTAPGRQADENTCRIVIAGWKILYLHAPHIAAAEDSRMNEIEALIRKRQNEMTASFSALKSRASAERGADIQEAEAAFTELNKVTAQVIALSRQNTNIKSFELSLGRKRKISAQCDEILAALQEAVKGREFKATR